MADRDQQKWQAKKLSYRWAKWLTECGQEVTTERRAQIESDIFWIIRNYGEDAAKIGLGVNYA